MSALPDLWSLRVVFMPGARLEIAEFLVQHLIHLGVKFDDLVVWITMIDEDVVAYAVSPWPPDYRHVLPAKVVAGSLYMRPVL